MFDMLTLYRSSFLALMLILSFASTAQISAGGNPIFFSKAFQEWSGPVDLQPYELPAPDLAAARREDRENPGNTRFALPMSADLSLENAGQWIDLPTGDRLWLLRLEAPGAEGLAVFYRDFHLPRGARLFMMDAQGRQVLGAYTERNNRAGERFMTGFLAGEVAILEYFEPRPVRGQGRFTIFRADFAYDREKMEAPDPAVAFGFGESSTCHVNVNCPVGSDWQDEKRGVCRIMMTLVEGTGWCSGSLVNNAENDGTQYLLSGFHCQDGYTPEYDLWRFDFQYEGTGCPDPAQEPGFLSVLGAQLVAGRQESDFLLLEILPAIPNYYDVYFNGWNRAAAPPSSSVLIHHPLADIQKISVDTQAAIVQATPLTWSNGVTTPANHHLRVVLDIGTFEPGSSGGPLFGPDGLIVGQLHGGFAGCNQVTTYSGRFSVSWDAGPSPAERLKEWLDPNNTGLMSVPGYDPPAVASGAVSGRVQTEWGEGVAGVTVTADGQTVQETLVTDTSGVYEFPDLPFGEAYTITFEKNYGADNGVTTLDMVFITKHILGVDPLDSPLKLIAADANNSNGVSTLDMVYLKLVILTLEDGFPNNTSWRFLPVGFPFSDPGDPFADSPLPNAIVINNLVSDLLGIDFYGIKVGDVNESADPSE